MPLLSANLNIMEKACQKASKLLIRDFGEVEKLQVSKKGPGDFVTNSDKRTEKIIINELSLARPGQEPHARMSRYLILDILFRSYRNQ